MMVPMASSRCLLPLTLHRPARSMKGIIINEGSDSSISISSSPACGNMVSSSPMMGDTASPGSDTMAETDQMATVHRSEIEPFPVLIVISVMVLVDTQDICVSTVMLQPLYHCRMTRWDIMGGGEPCVKTER